ncbi:hypothetical protein LX32DRAFT_19068 [Colletotrichum zoysiae]|uniref:Uncharacterized protein n=1 Tax=Colletotrichum zoysiae TaxID=1216348 RepID=A0AAD9HDV1_9PEZI|nr:hypothetical protein LX32DRAFT_19068 [Colletotrichum zoysiae]
MAAGCSGIPASHCRHVLFLFGLPVVSVTRITRPGVERVLAHNPFSVFVQVLPQANRKTRKKHGGEISEGERDIRWDKTFDKLVFGLFIQGPNGESPQGGGLCFQACDKIKSLAAPFYLEHVCNSHLRWSSALDFVVPLITKIKQPRPCHLSSGLD